MYNQSSEQIGKKLYQNNEIHKYRQQPPAQLFDPVHSHSTNFASDQTHGHSHFNSTREKHLVCQAKRFWQHLALSQGKHYY